MRGPRRMGRWRRRGGNPLGSGSGFAYPLLLDYPPPYGCMQSSSLSSARHKPQAPTQSHANLSRWFLYLGSLSRPRLRETRELLVSVYSVFLMLWTR